METWIGAALDYVPRWLAFQMRVLGVPGCAIAEGLHPAAARVTMAQLLSHSAGVVRDGTDGGEWITATGSSASAAVRDLGRRYRSARQ